VSIDVTSAGLTEPAGEAPDVRVNEAVARPGPSRRYVPLIVLAGLVLLAAAVVAATPYTRKKPGGRADAEPRVTTMNPAMTAAAKTVPATGNSQRTGVWIAT
jgi:hypothetical protein